MKFRNEHSKAWLELMAAYQDYRAKLLNWAKEENDVKSHDLHLELSIPICERDLNKRLLVLDFLRSTDMWDEKSILLISDELTEIALQEQEEVAAYARMALKKIRCQPERIKIANNVFILAAREEKQEKPDATVFHNGCMLLHDLGCKEQLKRFIDQYEDLIYLASGLDKTDLYELAELSSFSDYGCG